MRGFPRVSPRATLGDVGIALKLGKPCVSLHRQDGGRQRGLSVVNVSDGPDVYMRFHDFTLWVASPSFSLFCLPHRTVRLQGLHCESNCLVTVAAIAEVTIGLSGAI